MKSLGEKCLKYPYPTCLRLRRASLPFQFHSRYAPVLTKVSENGNFRQFSHISSFFSQKWFNVYTFSFRKLTGTNQFFHDALITIIIVDRDLSLKKSECHFFI